MPRARVHRVAVHLIENSDHHMYWTWNCLLAAGLVLESEHQAARTITGEWETDDVSLLAQCYNVASVVLLPPKEDEPPAKVVPLPVRVTKSPKKRSA